jgi:formylmethanofuran dehydrogenase subunit E
MQPERLTCNRCGKRLSRKTARLIDGRVLCSTCMFGPKPKEARG